MKLSRIAAGIAEGAFDLLSIILIMVILSGHRWLDITLWIVALVAIVGGTVLASGRRRREQLEITSRVTGRPFSS